MNISDNYSILPHCWVFFVTSMLFNCDSALDSVEKIDVVFEKMHAEEDLKPIKENYDLILNNLQNIICQAAALSRFFWPARKGENNRHERRAKELRETFQVTEDSPLKNRDIRNAIEHFDEKLDKYFTGRTIGFTMPKYIGPEPNRDGVKNHFFRTYFIDKGIFEILGERVEMEPLINEICRLNDLLEDKRERILSIPGKAT